MTKISFYGKISDLLSSEIKYQFEEDSLTISELRSKIAEQYDCPDLLDKGIRASINDELVSDSANVHTTDNIAFLSPFSGG